MYTDSLLALGLTILSMKTHEVTLFCNSNGGNAARPGNANRSVSLMSEPPAPAAPPAPGEKTPTPIPRTTIVQFGNPDQATAAAFTPGKRYKVTFEELADE